MSLRQNEYSPEEEFLEALESKREIEFTYKGDYYRLEPFYDGEDSLDEKIEEGYNIWKYENGFKDGGGIVIASIDTPEKVLSTNCFDGRNILDIYNETSDQFIL